MSKSIAMSGRKRLSKEKPAYSSCAMLTAAAFVLGISAAGNAEAAIYKYQGNILTITEGDQVLSSVTATIDYDELTSVDNTPASWKITGLHGQIAYGNPSANNVFKVFLDKNQNITSWDIDLSWDEENYSGTRVTSNNVSGDFSQYRVTTNDPCFDSSEDNKCIYVSQTGSIATPGVWSPTFMDPSNWSLTSGGVPLVAEQGGYILDLGGVDPGGYLQSSFTITNLNAWAEGQTLSGVFLAPPQVPNGGAFFDGFGGEFDLAGGESKTFTVSFDPIYADYFGPHSGNATLVTARSLFGINDSPNVFTPLFLRANLLEPAAVPEPASWALMIAGFGMTGAAMRRRALQTA